MIRMGRAPVQEEPSQQPAQADANDLYKSNSPIRAISESESIARDIKEGRLSGHVGAGTVLTGEITFQSMLRVDGNITGRVSSETGTLLVGSTGKVDANIKVAAAVINGVVNGDIVATERLEIGRQARVIGNITAPNLIIEEGAVFEGSCSMVKSRENTKKRPVEALMNGVPTKKDEPSLNGAAETAVA